MGCLPFQDKPMVSCEIVWIFRGDQGSTRIYPSHPGGITLRHPHWLMGTLTMGQIIPFRNPPKKNDSSAMNQPSSVSSKIKSIHVHPCPFHVFPQCLLVKPRLNMFDNLFCMSWFYPHWLTHSTLGPRSLSSLSSFHATGIPRCRWSSRTQGMLQRSWRDCHFFCTDNHTYIIYIYLLGGWPTPLKNMLKSVGMMKFPISGKKIVKKMFQTTNQYIYIFMANLRYPASFFEEKNESSAGYV